MKINLRETNLGTKLFLLWVFVFIPFIIVKCNIDTYYLEKRGVSSKATVIKVVGGLSDYTHTYRYEVNGEFYEQMEHRSSKKFSVGTQIDIIYDSLDYENCRIVWKKE